MVIRSGSGSSAQEHALTRRNSICIAVASKGTCTHRLCYRLGRTRLKKPSTARVPPGACAHGRTPDEGIVISPKCEPAGGRALLQDRRRCGSAAQTARLFHPAGRRSTNVLAHERAATRLFSRTSPRLTAPPARCRDALG